MTHVTRNVTHMTLLFGPTSSKLHFFQKNVVQCCWHFFLESKQCIALLFIGWEILAFLIWLKLLKLLLLFIVAYKMLF